MQWMVGLDYSFAETLGSLLITGLISVANDYNTSWLLQLPLRIPIISHRTCQINMM
jgi:hypothetical protein